jgi:hypothetical protein
MDSSQEAYNYHNTWGFQTRKEVAGTSSIKMTLGEILLASVNTAFTYFSASPNHCMVHNHTNQVCE